MKLSKLCLGIEQDIKSKLEKKENIDEASVIKYTFELLVETKSLRQDIATLLEQPITNDNKDIDDICKLFLLLSNIFYSKKKRNIV